MPSSKKDDYRLLCQLLNPFTEKGFECPSETNWPILWEIADQTHCLSELHQSIERLDLAHQLPEEMIDALAGIYQGVQLRCELLRDQLYELNAVLNQGGITPIWLKGASILLREDWQANARLMNDLDFWIPQVEQQADALKILDDLSYRVKNTTQDNAWEDSHHYAPRMHPERLATIEIHRHLIRPDFAELLPDADTLKNVDWRTWQSQPIGLLALEDRITHSLIQCSIMASPPLDSGFIRLMKVVDLLRLLDLSGNKQLPEKTIQRIKGSPFESEISAFLTLLERDFAIPNPLSPNQEYCQRVDKNPFTDQALTSWMRAKSFQPPVSWRNFLKNPRLWPTKIMFRLKMLFGQRLI